MKRFFTFFCLSALLAEVFALPVDPSAARAIAEKTLNKGRGVKVEAVPFQFSSKAKARVAAYAPQTASQTSPAYYLFNASDGNGFAIVAGEDQLPEVFGYSTTGNLNATDEIPEGLAVLLGMYEEYVEAVRKGKAKLPAENAQPASSSLPSFVAPLLKTKWGQGSPFNLLCPKSGNKTVPCGCVATAMSQVMYYWKHPAQGKGYITYNSGEIGGVRTKDLSESYYDWSVMGLDAASNSSAEAKQAVSTLCYDCGISVAMVYNPSGSGAYSENAMRAFAGNFSYRASTLRHLERAYHSSDSAWLEVVKSELAAGRPVMFGAQSNGGSGSDAGGHAFVLDGYDTKGFVHVNWGWDGSYNSYYDIALLNPGNYEFSVRQACVIGIMPDETGTDTQLAQTPVLMNNSFFVSKTSLAASSNLPTQIVNLQNYSMLRKTFEIGMGLFDASGNFLEEISTSTVDKRTVTLGGNHGDGQIRLASKLPATYTSGDYILRIVCREEGYEDWIIPYVYGGAEENNLVKIYVEDGVIYFNSFSSAIDALSFSDSKQPVIFDLQGRRLATDFELLPHGLYIIQGKKVWK